ncbi:MAG: biotin--[acetyl-CoA-carboxylase] ligase [Candidatus Aquicultorales bacterium]
MERAPILAVLKEKAGRYVSGEELAKRAGVSRTAIWKQINNLRDAGYGIDASTKSGYRLVSVPDLLLPEELAWELGTKVIGSRILYYQSVGSTNEEAKRCAIDGAADGTVLIAERQEGGRGRLGRGWFSPPGGIWISLILRPAIQPADAPKVMMLASSAVCSTMRSLGLEASIKWPNDVMIGGKKIAGILTEMASEPGMVDHLVVGMGINANIEPDEFTPDLMSSASSMSIAKGAPVDRLSFTRALLRKIDRDYEELLAGRSEGIVGEWRQACGTIGQDIALSTPNGIVRGTAIDVDGNGCLVLRGPEGTDKYASGDVTVVKE